jgi:hypothetical protein
MILLEKKRTVVAGEKQLVNALAEFRKLFREKFGACSLVCGWPGFSPVIGAKTPTAEIPTNILFCFAGSTAIECRQSPPAPGCHRERLGWFVKDATSDHISPPSRL